MWLGLWSCARINLNLPETDFWRLTPRQLAALMDRYKHKVEHDEFMLAQLTSYLINFAAGRPEKPVQPKDFMPSQWQIKAATAKTVPEMTEERRQTIANIFRAFAGVKVKEWPTAEST
jgi:hypothetical protein